MEQTNTPQEPQNPRSLDLYKFFMGLREYLADVIDLDKGVDKKATIQEIKEKKSMNGANAWMLMCSIVIASIGLSQNSQAVIIGAMLISPLMSPILGIGLGIGINDYSTLFQSLRHLGLAIAITLITSTIYFAVTPFDDFTEQIQARTEPTFLDIFIAIFGGIAGIVSIARKDISTTLPGVAIATALMPPLCVTGYGIAHLNWQITFTSFYLFFLNTFFVALSTYVIIKFLRFPLRKYVNPEEKRRNFRYVGLISLAAIVPSILIFRDVIRDVRQENGLTTFVEQYIGEERKRYLDSYELTEIDTGQLLVLKVYGNIINDSEIPKFEQALSDLNIENTRVLIVPSSEVDLNDISYLENKLLSLQEVTERLDESKKMRQEQEELMRRLEEKNQSELIDSTLFVEISDEVSTIFPSIKKLGLSNMQNTDFNNYEKNLPVVLIEWNDGKKDEDEGIKAISFLKKRLNLDTLVVLKVDR